MPSVKRGYEQYGVSKFIAYIWERYLWGKEKKSILYMKISIIHKEDHEPVR